jgi:hypothetical protein
VDAAAESTPEAAEYAQPTAFATKVGNTLRPTDTAVAAVCIITLTTI